MFHRLRSRRRGARGRARQQRRRRQMVMAARAAMDDASFEAAMRQTLQLDW
jgi:hypothetical protein